MFVFWPWRRGIVVIASAYRTEDIGFESHQGVRFLGLYIHTLLCCCQNLICICMTVIVFTKKIQTLKKFLILRVSKMIYLDCTEE
jgi:hypothetical protein